MSETDSRFAGREQGNLDLSPKPTPQRDICSALVLLVLAWGVLAWPWLSGRVTIPWDAKAHFLPQLQFLASSFARGESPFWTPFVFSGHPQIADPQSLIFSPPFVALAYVDASPTAHAADVVVFIMLLASAAALLVWLRDRGLMPAAALMSAISFAFGAAMAWRVQHIGQVMSLAYLPLVLLTLDRALERALTRPADRAGQRAGQWHSIGYALAAGTAAACLVLGRDQVALLCIYFLIAYVLYRILSADDVKAAARSATTPLATASVTGAALIAIPMLLTILVAGDSNRPEIDLEGAGRGSLHPALALTLFAPDVFGSSGAMGEYWGPPSFRWSGTGLFIAQNMGQLYIGALPVFALIYGVISRRLFQRDARFFTGALAVAFIYALGWYTPIFSIFHGLVPGVDLYRRPADAVFVIGCLASIIAGFSLDAILRSADRTSPRRWFAAAAIVAAAFTVMVGLAIQFDMLATARYSIATSLGLFAVSAIALMVFASARKPSPAVTATLIALLLTADLAWSNGPGGATALPPDIFKVLDPKSDDDTIAILKAVTAESESATRRDRVEIVGFGFHWPNASLTHRLDNTLGYNPLRLGSYTRATGAGDHVGLPDQKNFSPLFPSYRSTLADLLGLRYIATSVQIETIDKTLRPGDLRLLAKTSRGFIYENDRAMPRVMFASAAQSADFDTIAATGHWPAVDLATTVLLPKQSLNPAKPDQGRQRRQGTVSIRSYETTRVVIDVDSPDGGWVVLNDIWQPWWFATVDGIEATVMPANVLFRAVAVDAGRHTLTVTFEPVRGALRQLVNRH